MAMELQTFDPDGDLVLILSQRSEEQETQPEGDNEPALGSPDEITPILADDFASSNTLVQYPTCNPKSEPGMEIRLLVSSRHLMLASPVFKAMLQHSNFKEGEELHSTGKVEVPLPDDDPEAFKILLDIIHGRVRRVPRQVTLAVMASLAVLVDKYQMLECTELYVELWIPDLRKSLPASLTGGLLQWLSIAWIFKLPAEFKHLTRIAIRESSCKLGTSPEQEVLVPDVVLTKIEQQRQKGISDALFVVQRLINTFTQSTNVCNGNFVGDSTNKKYSCDGMMLGTLLKSASALELWPPPLSPYNGITVKNIMDRVRSLKLIALCDTWNPALRPAHGYPAWVKERADVLDSRVTGLDLESFR